MMNKLGIYVVLLCTLCCQNGLAHSKLKEIQFASKTDFKATETNNNASLTVINGGNSYLSVVPKLDFSQLSVNIDRQSSAPSLFESRRVLEDSINSTKWGKWRSNPFLRFLRRPELDETQDASSQTLNRETKQFNQWTSAPVVMGLAVDKLRLVSTWMTIPLSGAVDVIIEYNAGGARHITVDIISSSSGLWYGKGSVSVPAAGTATVAVTCVVEATQTYGNLIAGTEIIFSVWMITEEVYQEYLAQLALPVAERDSNKTSPWNYKLDKQQGYGKAPASKSATFSLESVIALFTLCLFFYSLL